MVVKEKTICEVKPLGDRVVVVRDEVAEVSPGGIFLSDSAKDKPARGTVVAVGPGKRMSGGLGFCGVQVKVGDRVLFTPYGPEEVDLGNGDEEEILLIREDDILAVLA